MGKISMPLPILRDITNLIEVSYNPNEMDEGDEAHLGASITEFGLVEPLVVNMHPGLENRIIGGKHRRRRLLAAGETEAPCVELSLPLDRERELNLRLNRNRGRFNLDTLAAEFNADELVAWGFSVEEVEEIPFPVELEASLPGFGFFEPPATALATKKAPVVDDRWIPFHFGDVKGRVERPVYDAFAARLREMKELTEQVMLDDVLKAWLGLVPVAVPVAASEATAQ